MYEERLEYWQNAHPWLKEKVDSETEFLDNFISKTNWSMNTNILEIGPGGGRQMKKVAWIKHKNYYVADISPNVCNDYMNSLLITWPEYKENLTEKVQLVHCWYVIHHVLKDELDNFINFINRQLTHGGSFIFNYPDFNRTMRPQDFANDGYGPSGTAKHTRQEIIDSLEKNDMTVIEEKRDSNSHTFAIWAKRI